MRKSIPFRTSPCDGGRTRGGCKTGTVCLHGEMRNGTSRIQLGFRIKLDNNDKMQLQWSGYY
jgi:hypothetical protein